MPDRFNHRSNKKRFYFGNHVARDIAETSNKTIET